MFLECIYVRMCMYVCMRKEGDSQKIIQKIGQKTTLHLFFIWELTPFMVIFVF